MKVSKDAARAARLLLRLSHKDGKLQGDLVKDISRRIGEEKPRGYLAMLQEYGRLLRLEVGKRQAVIESAEELGAQTGNELLEGLRGKYGDDLTAEFKVNPELIGGMRVKVGSDVWDGSVRARLTALRDNL
jgi:F-type H+-transporting ATPase subunit delta